MMFLPVTHPGVEHKAPQAIPRSKRLGVPFSRTT
jgi:hypothetical protein